MTVHHTAGSNAYSRDQVPAVLLAICKYHRNGNGWNDVGYNVLVDQYGGAWEGRAGGLTQAVVGAHAQGFNAVSAGVSIIGDFTSVAPPAAALAAVARVAAWKLAVAGVPRSGTVDLVSAGGSLARYGAGKVATLPRVFGHRDVGQTACPGAMGYPALEGVRAAVAAADPTLPVNLPPTPAPTPAPPAPVKITISTKQRVSVGSSAVVSGTATQGSAPLKSATLALQVGSGDSWQTVSTTRTNAAGKYRFARKFTRTWGVRVARTDGNGGTSARVEVAIVPKLTLTVPKRMRVNRKLTLRGTIAPGRGPVTLSIERRTKSGKYVSVVKAQKTKLSGRRVTVNITPHSATLYRFRLSYAGSDLATAAKSPLVFGRGVSGTTGGGASLN
ncbi:MAG: N-acetylmuramoyl-L-alanine amidase [Solirubrobacteraceae bacterium]|nr:N-acetylmuramoyl-L-alanine amidase [Solirubrobacteraceae bacterium]